MPFDVLDPNPKHQTFSFSPKVRS
uniref:Uncharacterized protein n=1 Tax=Anguilla anguilla TaxID=7936 RepID=A0A0E9RP40_ANGAN